MADGNGDDILVLRDGGGAYYALPRATLAAHRVPDEARGRLEALLGGGDVAGFDFGVPDRLAMPAGQKYPHLGALADGDIMAISFIVMMEAQKSVQEDLRAIMAGAKAANTGGRWPP